MLLVYGVIGQLKSAIADHREVDFEDADSRADAAAVEWQLANGWRMPNGTNPDNPFAVEGEDDEDKEEEAVAEQEDDEDVVEVAPAAPPSAAAKRARQSPGGGAASASRGGRANKKAAAAK